MQRNALQIAWAVVCYLPKADNFSHRHHEPDRMFEDFDNIVARTAMNFTFNFLLACPKEFYKSEALLEAVNCNTRESAMKAAKKLLDLFNDWEPLEHLYSIDAYSTRLVDQLKDPITYWTNQIKEYMTVRLTDNWPTQKNALKNAFNKLAAALESPELVEACVMKISKILIILVKRPKELFHEEPWIAMCDVLTKHINSSVELDMDLAEKIKEKRFYSNTVPSRVIIEMGKALEADMAMIPLMSPKIFEQLSEPVIEMTKDLHKSFMTDILNEIAHRVPNDGESR